MKKVGGASRSKGPLRGEGPWKRSERRGGVDGGAVVASVAVRVRRGRSCQERGAYGGGRERKGGIEEGRCIYLYIKSGSCALSCVRT
jgi:hypothetical protein